MQFFEILFFFFFLKFERGKRKRKKKLDFINKPKKGQKKKNTNLEINETFKSNSCSRELNNLWNPLIPNQHALIEKLL